jgi:hypothetical protein
MCSPHQHRLGPPNREGRNVTVREVSRHNDGGKIIIVVVRTLGFLIVRRLLGLVGLGPREYARDVEIAVLRHQLAGAASAGRPPPPVQPGRSDTVGGAGPVATSGPVASVLVTPATRLRWHREMVARRWTYLPAGGSRRILPELRSMWCFVGEGEPAVGI